MTQIPQSHATQDPIDALLRQPGGVLAVITAVQGPSYHPVGAMMALFGDNSRVGTLSSGCIEADLHLHAQSCLETRTPLTVLYGLGSPYMDIQLPCGGGLEILLIPRPDIAVLTALQRRRADRQDTTLGIDPKDGRIWLDDSEKGQAGSHWAQNLFHVHFPPVLQFLIFGKGPEASTFAGLVQSAGYQNLMLSPDAETLEIAAASGCQTRHLTGQSYPKDLPADDQTAIILFFHDHDWEPPILTGALNTQAFYIGSQGSQRARDTRLDQMRQLGVPDDQLNRLTGPVGLIPSARDAGTLAVSVLAEILSVAMHRTTAKTP